MSQHIYTYDSANDQLNVIGGVGHVIQDETGTSFTNRENLKFEGATVTDDSTNNTTVVEIPEIVVDATLSTTSEHPVQNKVITSALDDKDAEISDMNNILGAKNLLPNTAVSQTVNEVDIIVRPDGSIVLDGTANSMIVLNLFVGKLGLDTSKQYILSGLGEKTSGNFFIQLLQPSTGAIIQGGTEEYIFTPFPETATIYYQLVIGQDESFSSYIVNPMIRPASIKNKTFVSYAMTNRELTTKITKTELKQSERHYLLIFDSYGAIGVSTIVEEACTGGVHTLDVGGAGFVGAGGGQNWGQATNNYLASLTQSQLEEFTDVMIFGGINDFGGTRNSIISAMTSFNTMINSYLNNPRVTVCPISYVTRKSDHAGDSYFSVVVPAYMDGCIANNWRFVDGLNAPIHVDTYIQSDGIHPNSTGIRLLGEYIKQFVKTDVLNKYSQPANNVTFTPDTGITDLGTTLHSQIDGDNVTIFGTLVVQANNKQWNLNSSLKIGTITNSWMYGFSFGQSYPCAYTIPLFVNEVGVGVFSTPATITIYEGTIYLTQLCKAAVVDTIQSVFFSFTMPRNMC